MLALVHIAVQIISIVFLLRRAAMDERNTASGSNRQSRASHHSTTKTDGVTTILLVNNIHCSSCVDYAREVLFFLPHVRSVDISIIAHEVRVRHDLQTSSSDLVKTLANAAFEVFHATTYNESGSAIDELETPDSSGSPWLDAGLWRRSTASVGSLTPGVDARKSHHIANCSVCRQEQEKKKSDLDKDIEAQHIFSAGNPEDKSGGSHALRPLSPALDKEVKIHPLTSVQALPVPDQSDEEYDAILSIGGMTCAACVNTVTGHLEELDFVTSANVNLLTNSATVTFRGPRENIDKIIDRIEDTGFDGRAEEVSLKRQPQNDIHVANLSVIGMTCGSCVGSITRAIQEFQYVKDVVVDLLGNSARVQFEGREKLDEILSRIDDLGFDATVIDCEPLAGGSDDEGPKPRVVQIQIDGMYCANCPQTALDSLDKIPDNTLVVEENPTIEKPILTVSYTPNSPSMTIRSLIAAIDSTDDAIKASIYHPPTIEDRSRAMQRHEQKRLLLRLLFVFIVAIPEFLIGIVWMAIVPKTDRIRSYLEEPMWAGRASRLEWALFIMTTPVMVFGTDVFHVRAIKEIRSLWRPSSRVPILRRFYRFGSMNMLISAGTSVAYFASVAVLIVNATTKEHSSGHTSTYFDTVVFLTLFILSGRALEGYSKAKTGDAVAMLGKLRPSEALLVVDSLSATGDSNGTSIQRVSVDLLEIGDTVSVPHGGSPPADGLVTATGSYKFDESSLTGESLPVGKTSGDKVYSGSVNVGQPVAIEITDLGSTSMLDQIVAVVREGQAKRAPVERVADIMTGYFVPIITLIAITTFILWVSLGESGSLPDGYLDTNQGGWEFWSLQFAIAVFVVACPCGLALAAPTALFVGGGLAAKRGILVRGGGEAFQEASRLDAIVFDKTGTLTEGGTLRVSDHETLVTDKEEQQVAWALAKALEESSTHPIARAIVEFCNEHASTSIESSSITETSGQGMKGIFTLSKEPADDTEDGTNIEYEAAIGNQRLLDSLKTKGADTYYLNNLLSKYQSAGKSTAILSLRKVSADSQEFVPAMVFATSDPLRAEATKVIADLRAKNIDVHMCTGDNTATAHAVAASLGIPSSNVMANVLPSQKAEYIKKVQNNEIRAVSSSSPTPKQKKKDNAKTVVAFVGDGTNDSPALAAADVSVAMASGSDVAVNAAGFILLNSDLNTILELCTLSRRVFRRVKWNFLWAAIYNTCLIPVAAGVFYPIVSGHSVNEDGTVVNTHWRLDPVWAALAMALSSVSVVLSSLALRLEWRDIKTWPGRVVKKMLRR